MPSTNIYIAYVVAGVSTFSGSMSGIPAFSHNLDLNAHEAAVSAQYQNLSQGLDGCTITSVTREPIAYPLRGDKIVIKAKAKVSKFVPKLEKEKYTFSIFEG